MLNYNPQKTNSKKRAVKKYLEKNVLSNKFICKMYKSCKSSCKYNFYEGQLHHIGNYYDLIVNRVPYRIVVVGQEYGLEDSKYSMEKRYKQVMDTGTRRRFFSENGYEARNPHMRGTTSVLKALFGLSNEPEYKNEFIRINGKQQHIFDCFALVNYLLCSALSNKRKKSGKLIKKGKSTSVMKNNCREHFRKVLEILEPNIVVVQGEGFFKWIEKSFDSSKYISENIYKSKINSSESFLLKFSHPAAQFPKNWGVNASTPYLLETVLPTVKKVRRMIGVN